MPIVLGTRFGPYEIISAAGAGGMGEVYRAKDTRLDRIVAVKVLPSELANNAEKRQRFEREARSISTLSHPHICTLHDIGQQNGVDYLVLEYLEGQTLEKRLEKGSLPTQEALKYAIELADALDKAHRQGIIHRDIKPGNIMLTKSGVKLMDFGLAKLKSETVPVADALTEMSSDKKLTAEGTILGTFQYMAPEQLEGLEADARTDIFAFGEVLYEMVTHRPAFSGRTKASLIAAILSNDPKPITELAPMSPPALDHVLRTCLAKDPDDRWQTARDLLVELKWIVESGGQTAGAAPSSASGKTRERLAWITVCALAVALIVTVIWWRNAKPPEQTMYFSASLPFPAHDMAFSPNRRTLAVVGYQESARKNAIWIYEVGSQGARILSDTEGASYPFWSPDGRTLAFFADGKLKKLDLSGGPVQIICDAPSGRGGTWNKDGVIVFTPDATLGNGLYRVSASGGIPTQISRPDPSRGEESHRYPMFLPDGSHYLYLAANFSGRREEVDAIFVGLLDSNEKRLVTAATANAAYAAPGYLLFCRGKTLLAQRFDLKRFALTGEPATILTEVHQLPQTGRAVFGASDDGLLAAQTGSQVALSQLLWFDRKGKELGAVGKPGVYGNVSLAPNGKSVAVNKTDTGSLNTDVWIYELQRDSSRRLTFNPGFNVMPIWNPDASRLTFASNRQLSVDLFVKNSDGAQEEQSLVRDEQDKFPYDWSRDARYILYAIGNSSLNYVSLPELKTSLFLKVPSVLRNAQFSPDEKWVAYASNETGKWEIYVTSFPEARGRWQVSTGGGEQPRWRGDGKELLYLSSDGKMMAAPVTIGANFDVGRPVELFQTTPRQPVSFNDQVVYDVRPDGQRFLILTQMKQAESAPMSIVLNWAAKLKK
jgi:serine/threonine protein kinase/Tol biopolymer transport system component